MCPLLFESTTLFHFLGANSSAAVLGGSTAAALAVSWRRQLQTLAWIALSGAVATAAALAVATGELGPFALVVIVLGVAALWFGYVFEWTLLRWPAALFADLSIVVLSLRAVTRGAADGPRIAFAAQVALLVGYLGSFVARTLVLNRDVIPFEVAQSVAAIIVGLGGAMVIGGGRLPLAVTTLALAVGCYSAAAIFVERLHSRRRNYYFYTSAGLVFALAGGAMAASSTAAGLLYAVLGVAAASAGRLSERVTYRAHGAAYLVAAVVAAGLVTHVLYGVGLPVVPGGRPSAAMIGVLALCGFAMWGLGVGADPPRLARRVPRVIVLLLLLGGVLGATASGLVTPSAAARAWTPGLVATIRTALLVATVLSLALADRVWGFIEGAWLVYPLLILTGLKFIVEDFPTGRPSTLFVGFALYGLALIVGPRLCRRRGIGR